MSNNIFDNEHISFLVLSNDEKQYSLWPESCAIPDGWQVAFGPHQRDECLQWVNVHWCDLRPKSLQVQELS
ncbi:Protein MbtH [Pseudoalteromonas holothuriae]|uniref:Protein MbtH n=1 Tax=Pseudoalteromonas holothuriae TaxID=2963714 RepID=A0A9W4QSH1_9GAMM|nr:MULTISPECIES: MbtH family NRPS accessory protein [unclassified Pseudoalteromonas]CAH9051206.1 Protein MbtH [Pseudoalteromonas sp. CIP111854]CAH9056694.1 Protein MbtH [Pseudoalteromonas sp. CIP111951]